MNDLLTVLDHALYLAERRAADFVKTPIGDVQMLRAVVLVGVTGGAGGVETYLDLNASTVKMALKRLEDSKLVQRLPFEEKAPDGNVMRGRRTVAYVLGDRGVEVYAAFRKRLSIERERALVDMGFDPKKLEAALAEFEPSVRVANRRFSDEPTRDEQLAGREMAQFEDAPRAKKGARS